MNLKLLCKIRGHVPKLELFVIPKGTTADSGMKGVNAVFAISYYGAKVRCSRCGDLLDYKEQEEYKL